VYQIAVLIWIMIGLGYLVMILGFISRAYRSKRLNRLEKKLTTTIKQTHSRIWGEFMEDISYVRRVLNEMYLLKVKVHILNYTSGNCFHSECLQRNEVNIYILSYKKQNRACNNITPTQPIFL
jgi:hypothetical protein